MTFRAAEFFAGIGLVRLGLEEAGFQVSWANDWSEDKHLMYRGQFGEASPYVVGDIADVSAAQIPNVDLAWASFPCTDLSLAGGRSGLSGEASGTFFEWIRILDEMGERRPAVVAAENVVGLATSRGGDDLRAAVQGLNALGYSVDVIMLDARRFVPQSRQRLFLVGTTLDVTPGQSDSLRPEWLRFIFDDPNLKTHQAWLPEPPPINSRGFSDAADRIPLGDEAWWSPERVQAFLGSLSDVQQKRLDALQASGTTSYRTAYRRTRNGSAVWEIRADDLSGCLRTARGGSSKQAVVRAGNGSVMVRWMTAHEYAVLMGAPAYNLQGLRPSQVMFGCGDAVVVPVVHWLSSHYLAPLLAGTLSPPLSYAQ